MSTVDGMARILAAAGVGAYSPTDVLPEGATPITVAGWPALDGPAVVVTTYAGGPEPDSRNGYEFPRLQVKVRGTDPLAAMDLERATYEALQFTAGGNAPRALADGAWLNDCHALQSEPEPLGRDDNGRWEYARNYQLTVQPA